MTVKPLFAAVVLFGALLAGVFLGFGVGMTVGVKVEATNNRQLNAFMDIERYDTEDVMMHNIYGLLDRLGKYEKVDLEKEYMTVAKDVRTARSAAWVRVFPTPKSDTK
jgi:hypothetical protein